MSDPYEDFPDERTGRGRVVVRVLLAAMAVGLLVLAAVGVWAQGQINPGEGGEPVRVTVPKGATTGHIAAILDEHGVVANARLFRLYVRFKGAGPFQAGDYDLRRRQRYDDVISVLQRGAREESHRVTIPEGYTLAQVAERVGRLPGRSRDRFLELARSGQFRSAYQPAGNDNVEGLLFPDTYELRPDEDEAAILRRMLGRFDQVAGELGIESARTRFNLTPYEVVVVASMIEREARVADERPMVARVVYNRIKRGMTLGIDATIRYALNKPTGPLRQSELNQDNPYNTRLRPGLPPTPIANPGRAALEGALRPADGPWLYYVLADEQGRHTFATTDAEFQRAVAVCRQRKLGC